MTCSWVVCHWSMTLLQDQLSSWWAASKVSGTPLLAANAAVPACVKSCCHHLFAQPVLCHRHGVKAPHMRLPLTTMMLHVSCRLCAELQPQGQEPSRQSGQQLHRAPWACVQLAQVSTAAELAAHGLQRRCHPTVGCTCSSVTNEG